CPLRAFFSYGGVAALASANSYRVVDPRHENLAIADAARMGRGANCLYGLLDHLILDDQLVLYLVQEVDDVFTPPLNPPRTFFRPNPLASTTVMPFNPI